MTRAGQPVHLSLWKDVLAEVSESKTLAPMGPPDGWSHSAAESQHVPANGGLFLRIPNVLWPLGREVSGAGNVQQP